MSVFGYLHDKLVVILLQIISMILLALFLLMMKNSVVTVVIILLFWSIMLVAYLTANYWKRKRFFEKINKQMESLDKPYLISEFIENTWYYEDRLYKEIMERMSKSALEGIADLEMKQDEYKSFIEGWIHEVKLPMTNIYLASAKLEPKQAQKIIYYLTDLENQVEQALFYARGEHVYKDYFIQETVLLDVIRDLLKKNKYILIQNQMQIEINCEAEVLTDKKWLGFILNQLIFNAVKYKKGDTGKIIFTSVQTPERTELRIEDRGIGIKESELPRVFEKGFTGSNGRSVGKSTGFGLYLCKKLCQKLGLAIQIAAKENEYTQVTITFPNNSYISKL